MKIKGANEEYNVTGQGQGTYNTVAGSLGLASFLGFNAGNVFGGRNNGGCGCQESEDKPVTRYEAKMQQELAAKDGKIALLESNIYTDQKIADVYERLTNKINANRDEQNAINMEQAVYNGTNTATLQCLKGQVQQLFGLTKLVVPATNICPQPTTGT